MTGRPTNKGRNKSIESVIRCKDKQSHLLHVCLPEICHELSKRCACSISVSTDGVGFAAFSEEASSKRWGFAL
jgi:hypothetical protein